MEIIRTADGLRARLANEHNIGFVPTMGALHSGHASLVRRAKEDGGTVVASIFVNPTQFNDPNDLRNYPRTESADLSLLDTLGVDVAFVPAIEEIYPKGYTSPQIELGEVAQIMEGASRPGHFGGVCQVVSRLFDLVHPQRAYFGEKDFQQIAVVVRMVELLSYDVQIVGCPIVREADGLAMSSRNRLLTPEVRAIASDIYSALQEINKQLSEEEIASRAIVEIERNGLLKVLYFEIACLAGQKRAFVAVQAGAVRLIDNVLIEN